MEDVFVANGFERKKVRIPANILRMSIKHLKERRYKNT